MELSFGEKLALITAVLTAAATVASICVVSNARVRNAIFIGLGLGLSFVLGLLAWPLIWQGGQGGDIARARPSPVPTPPLNGRPTPSPSPSKPTPTPAKATPADTEVADAPEAVSLYASSADDATARARYCVVGDFTAESRQGAKAFDVTLTSVNLSLCNYSAHGSRRIKIRVGYRGNSAGQIYWSRPVTLADRLQPGQSITLSDPIPLGIPKHGSANLTNDNFVVELINVPTDTNREMHYHLSSQRGTLIAQLKAPR